MIRNTIAYRCASMLLALALIIAGVSANGLNSARAQNKKVKGLAGSWDVAATTPTQGSFNVFISFFDDGNVIADEPGSEESSGHGNWSATGGPNVAYTFKSVFGNANQQVLASLKVVGTLQYNVAQDNWTGPFKIEVFDPNGNLVFSDRGTFTGTRIAIEALN
jgi:hypothetical protein